MSDDEKWLSDSLTHAQGAAQQLQGTLGDNALQWEAAMCDKIQHTRKLRGWSQADLAGKITAAGFPMHQTTVAKLESGSRPLRVAELAVIAWLFGVPPAYFVHQPAAGETAAVEFIRDKLASTERRLSEFQDKVLEAIRGFSIGYAEMSYERLLFLQQLEAAMKASDGER